MGEGNWIVESLSGSLEKWSEYLGDIWSLLTTSPQDFKGGGIWSVIENIHGGMKAIGYSLLVLFFVIGVMKTTTNFSELKRPEQAVKLFIRFAIAKGIVGYSMDLMMALFKIGQGVITKMGNASGLVNHNLKLPNEITQKIVDCGFMESIPLWMVAFLGSLLITVLSFVMILTVYSRFFTLYMYTAIAPVPLSTFAGEGTSQVGKHFLKSYVGVCLQGAIILLGCIIYSAFLTKTGGSYDDLSTVAAVWKYIGEVLFNMLILVGSVKAAEKITKDMIGF